MMTNATQLLIISFWFKFIEILYLRQLEIMHREGRLTPLFFKERRTIQSNDACLPSSFRNHRVSTRPGWVVRRARRKARKQHSRRLKGHGMNRLESGDCGQHGYADLHISRPKGTSTFSNFMEVLYSAM
jgi:hypothetical protein